MPELRNVRRNEDGDWVANVGLTGSEEKVDVSRTSSTGTPLDVEYKGEKHNEQSGQSRYPSSDEDSNR